MRNMRDRGSARLARALHQQAARHVMEALERRQMLTADFAYADIAGSTGNDAGAAVVTDSAGNAYVTGTFHGQNIDFDPGAGVANLGTAAASIGVFIAKYNSSGGLVWVKGLANNTGFGTTGQVAAVGGIALDGSGN